MAIVVRTPVASNNGGGGTSITVTFPSGLTAGDVLVFAVSVRGGTGTTITNPSGWTLVGTQQNSGTTLAQKLYWKVATASDVSAGSVVVTITSRKASAVCYALEGADSTAAPVSAQYSHKVNASSLTVSYATRGSWTASDGVDLVFGGMAYGGNTVGTPASYTNGANGSSTGGSASTRTQTHGSHRALTGATTVSTLTETWTGTAGVNIGSAVFIKVAFVQTTVYAPIVTASTSIPTGGYTTTQSLSGQPGLGRLGRFTLGDVTFGATVAGGPAYVQVTTYAPALSATIGSTAATASTTGYPEVDAPLVTAAASTSAAVSDLAGAPAAVAATASVIAGTASPSGSSVAAPLVTVAGAVTDAMTALAGAPAAATATGAVAGGLVAAAAVPDAATAVGAIPTAAAGAGTFPGAVTAAGATLAPLSALAGVPGVLAAAATDLAASVSTSVYTSVNASLVTAAAGPLAPEWHVTVFPGTAAATGATAAASVSAGSLTSVSAPLVTASGTELTATAGLAALVSLVTATGATLAALPAVAGKAPLVAAVAGSQQGGVSGDVPTRVGGGPPGSASALIPQISGAYPTPSGEASSMRPT